MDMPSVRLRVYFFTLLFWLSCISLQAQNSASAAGTDRPDAPLDAKEIVRRGLDADQHNFDMARDYTFERRDEVKMLDKKGNAKKHDINTYDVLMLYDQPYSRRIGKDDKPLSDKDEKKEAEKLDKFTSERQNETDSEHAKRVSKFDKQRNEERAFARDILNAFDFRLDGEDQIDGRPVYVIEANPRRDFHPTQPHADMLSKVRGKVWIDKQNYGWVKLTGETLDTISWGFLILRIHKGTAMEFKQVRVNDEVWLPSQVLLNGSARIALLAGGTFDMDISFSNYKKFSSGSRILPGATEVQPTASR